MNKYFIGDVPINSNEKSKMSVNQIKELNRMYLDMKIKEQQSFSILIAENKDFLELKFICEQQLFIFENNKHESILYKRYGRNKKILL